MELSCSVRFFDVDWKMVQDQTGAYVIYDKDEVVYVGMAGRDQNGSPGCAAAPDRFTYLSLPADVWGR